MSEKDLSPEMLAEFKNRKEIMRDSQERKDLMWHYLDITFFASWRDTDNESRKNMLYSSLELMTSNSCNLNCTYCYYHQNSFGPQLNPASISKKENLVDNTRKLFNYLKEEKLYPKTIELFGGEVFLKPVTFKIMDMVIDFIDTYPEGLDRPDVIIPTNFSWVMRPEIEKKIRDVYQRVADIGSHMVFSSSIDGKYMDPINRPSAAHKNDQAAFYNDEKYNKVFAFAKEFHVGFHPMIHYDNIEQWPENFTWFQRKMEEYDIPWHQIYLLEVRNDGWTPESIRHYSYFFKFVLNFIFNKCGQDLDRFMNDVIFTNGSGPPLGMNLINNLSTVGRGIGCGMQTSLPIRMGDLMVSPCHRQSYDYTSGFRFVTDDNTITDIDLYNLEYYLTMGMTSVKTWPYCETCAINEVCTHGCPGSQFESMGDPFTPIPSVCMLQFAKVRAEIEFFDSIGILDLVINRMDWPKANAFKLIYKILQGE